MLISYMLKFVNKILTIYNIINNRNVIRKTNTYFKININININFNFNIYIYYIYNINTII
jgi:hypothetical protein